MRVWCVAQAFVAHLDLRRNLGVLGKAEELETVNIASFHIPSREDMLGVEEAAFMR